MKAIEMKCPCFLPGDVQLHDSSLRVLTVITLLGGMAAIILHCKEDFLKKLLFTFHALEAGIECNTTNVREATPHVPEEETSLPAARTYLESSINYISLFSPFI